MSKPIFKFKNVSYSNNGQNILSNISFDIAKGECLTILGSSGAGKSSLLRLFNNLQSPSKGNIYFDNQALEEIDVLGLRKKVGMVFQTPILVSGTVKTNLNLFQNWDKNRIFSKNELTAVLETVELKASILDQEADLLSGGEKQRLALARTLLNDPEVILLDEPTSGLDPKLARRIIKLIARLHDDLSLTVILVTHHPRLIKDITQKILFLHKGEIMEYGKNEILLAPASTEMKNFMEEERGTRTTLV